MCLHVLSKLDPAVWIIIDCFAGDYGPGTDRLGDSVLVGKSVDPEDALEDHIDDHTRRVLGEWCGVVSAPRPFFYRSYASFDLWDVFVFSCNVQTGV